MILRIGKHLRREAAQHSHIGHHFGFLQQVASLVEEANKRFDLRRHGLPRVGSVNKSAEFVPADATQTIEIEGHRLGHFQRRGGVGKGHVVHAPRDFVSTDARSQLSFVAARAPSFVPERFAAPKHPAMIARAGDPASHAARVQLDKDVLAHRAGIAGHVPIGVGQRLAGEVEPCPAQEAVRGAGHRRFGGIHVGDASGLEHLGREVAAQVSTETFHRVGVTSGTDGVIVEVDQVGFDFFHRKLDQLAIIGLRVGVVAVPVVSVRLPAVGCWLAVRAEHDPVLRLGNLLEEQLPEQRAAIVVNPHLQPRLMVTLGKPRRVLQALSLGLHTGAPVAVDHHEVHAKLLQPGNHLGTVLPFVVGTLLCSGNEVPLFAEETRPHHQRLPAPGHHDTILPQPLGTLVHWQSQRLGKNGTRKTKPSENHLFRGHAYYLTLVSRSGDIIVLRKLQDGSPEPSGRSRWLVLPGRGPAAVRIITPCLRGQSRKTTTSCR